MFAKMKTRAKVQAGFGIAIAISVIVGLVGYRGISKLGGHVNEIGKVRLPSVAAIERIKIGCEQVRVAERTLINLDLSADIRKRQYETAAQGLAESQAAWKVYESFAANP